jgi:hypothetical protein
MCDIVDAENHQVVFHSKFIKIHLVDFKEGACSND